MVVSKIISWISILAVAFIAVSFGMFALDEAKIASDETQIATPQDPNPVKPVVLRDEHGRQVGGGSVRMKIDNVADELTAPAEQMVGDRTPWVMRGATFLIGLAFWGLFLQWLARMFTVSGTRRPARPYAPS